MNILITGGSGYLGSKLIPTLSGKISCLDSKEVKGSTFLQGDIRDPDLDLSEFDVIYHLAAVSAPKLVEKDSDLAWDVNVNGTLNLCKKLKKGQKIIFMSSAHVYGKSTEKHNEDEIPDPGNLYGLTKLVGEEIIKHYSRQNGFDHVIFRLFNSYSADQKKGLLVGDAIEKYRNNDVVELYNPRTRLDLIHANDAITVLSKSMQLPSGTYNLCSGHTVTVQQVYDCVSQFLNIKKPTKILSDNEDCLIGDNSKLKSIGFDFCQFKL